MPSACPPFPACPAGANTTYWGIFSSNATAPLLPLTYCEFGPYINWIGRFRSSVVPTSCSESRWTVENSGPALQLQPADLFAAQRARRGLVPP
jgi:hypothetical protein